MKKTFTMLALGLVLVLSGLGNTPRAEAKTLLGDLLGENGIDVGISASMDYYDKYVWRGMLLDEDSVLQPAVTLSAYGFEGGFWGSWDVEAADTRNSDETDGWIGYGTDLGFLSEKLAKVSVSAGHTWYNFSETGTYSKEFYLGFSLDTFLSPTVTWYHDYGKVENGGVDGDYVMAGVSHSFDLVKEYGIILDLGQGCGYNDKAFINGHGSYWLTTLGFTVPLTENLTMSPKMGYSIPTGDLESEDDGNYKEYFYGGVSLAMEF